MYGLHRLIIPISPVSASSWMMEILMNIYTEQPITNKIFRNILSLVMIISVMLISWLGTPLPVYAASHSVADGESLNLTTGVLTHANSTVTTLTISTGDTIQVAAGASATISGSADVMISCGAGVTLTLNAVTIVNGLQSGSAASLTFTGSNNTLILVGSSTLKSYAKNWTPTPILPAVQVTSGTAVTIEGSGSLTAIGGGDASYGGAGIGGGDGQNAGTITINSGTITAEGGYYSAGIGAGQYATGTSGTITINGGTVTATGGNRAAGIGGGGSGSSGGTITITGGSVTATSGTYGAGIGGGTGGDGGTINISGGTINATAITAYGAGIGGGQNGIGGTITISGGTITASGAEGGTGIGGGFQANGGSITISGGTITASGANNTSGIGDGMNAKGAVISISGGTIDADGTGVGAGIGTSTQGAGTTSVSISGTPRIYAGPGTNYALYAATTIDISGTGFICLGNVNPANVSTSSHSHDTSPVIDGVANTINDYSVPSSWTGKTQSGYFPSEGPHQVTFEENGGSSVDDMGAVHGSLLTPPSSTRTGYDMAEWYLEPGFVTPWNFNSDTVTSDITLYAKWISIELSANMVIDGDGSGTTVGTITGADGYTIQLADIASYPDNAFFSISGDKLMFSSTADQGAKNSYTINLEISTSTGVSTEIEITVTVMGDGTENGGQVNEDTSFAAVNTNQTINPEVNDTMSAAGTAWSEHRMITIPSNGSAELGSIIYTPDPDFVGTDTLTYIICDNADYCMRSSATFTVTSSADTGIPTATLPATGFAPGVITTLPEQPDSAAYADSGMTLEIPSLGITMPITGVPLGADGWDVTWLGQSAGYLEGSAFPTRTGNTVLTGHVWDSWNQPGPFAELRTLHHGDTILIQAWGSTYTYEVRENRLLFPRSVDAAFEHEEYDWVTLLTCEFFDPMQNSYLLRRAVRAVLVDVR